MKVFTVFLITLAVAVAQRDESLKVISNLRALQPAYRDLTMFVVDAVAGSKRNVSDIINEFQSKVVQSKEKYVLMAIDREQNLMRQINDQDPGLVEGCLPLVRDKVDKDMQLAGFKFSSCILEIDEKINQQISKVYVELDENSGSPKNISIYEAFRGRNIFQNPEVINILLEEKLSELQKLPTELIAELQRYVNEFQSGLSPIIGRYNYCLIENDNLLGEAFNVILKQLNNICEDK